MKSKQQPKSMPKEPGVLMVGHKPGDGDLDIKTGVQKTIGEGRFYYTHVSGADNALLGDLSIQQTRDALLSAADALEEGKPEIALKLAAEAFARIAAFQFSAGT